MIAMQYSFPLPADYEMAIVDRRISERGHLLDDFPDLAFKAYLTARVAAPALRSAENLYAPFYVWRSTAGMNEFLCGKGFVGVTQSFGWPSVRTWSVWHSAVSPDLREAVFATREILAIPPHAALEDLRRRAVEAAAADVERHGALAAVAGFDPTGWTQVRLRLWRAAVPVADGVQGYDVGHMSVPQAR